MLGEQVLRARVRTVLNDAVALSSRQAEPKELFPASAIQVESLLVAAPSFLYAFCDRLRIALQFCGSLSGLFPYLAELGFVVVCAAAYQTHTGCEKAHHNQAEP